MRTPLRIFHGLMAGLFVFAAALQYNDLNPLRWAIIYLAAALVTGLAAAGRPKPRLAAVVLIVALAWVTPYLMQGYWRVSFPALFDEWEMRNETMTAGREMYGLFIVSVSMALVCVSARLQSRR
ncbi:MAG TPA: transmembrane 220 family protein [Opitutaceae bacterium]|nr:transmembrane 220 family protein [Opitutaceae bacterium]